LRVSCRGPPAGRGPSGRGAGGPRGWRARGAGAGRRRRRAGHDAGRAPRRPGSSGATGRGRAAAAGRALLGGAGGPGAGDALRAADGGVKISVLAFDLSDNATGRADLLARLLASRWEVEVVGPRFGDEVWTPARGGAVSHESLAVDGARRYPRFAGRWRELVDRVDGDLLYASKPRPTSYGTALLARRRRRRPLLLDIDDWGAGFFRRGGGWGRFGRALNLANPNGLPWTWLMERLVSRADAVTVASRFLQRRFGGTLIPHARDTDAWDPARFDRAMARTRLGLGAERVVMFLGTPRGHKGVDDLVDAVELVGGDV